MQNQFHIGDTLHLARADYVLHCLDCPQCVQGVQCGEGDRLMFGWIENLGRKRRLAEADRIRAALVAEGAVRIPSPA